MPEESFQERTEKATPRRVKEAREKGQVARSQELSAVVVMMAGAAAFLMLGSTLVNPLKDLSVWLLGNSTSFNLTPTTTATLLIQVSWLFFKSLAPFVLLIAVAAIAITYLQVGSLFSTAAIEPKFDRLNPFNGLKNLFTAKSAFTITRDVLKLTVVVLVAYFSIKSEIPTFIGLAEMEIGAISSVLISVSLKISFKILLALLIIALLDFAYQKFSYAKGLRMSAQDIKEEYKLTEGNPLVKSRIRAIQREQSRKRMMQKVPKADVVITNPTHIAVALKYESGSMDAPTVIAKGERLLAEAIKRIAAEAGVPIVENKPLAQALFKTVEVGMQVPATLYKAVAEVLAYIYSLKDKNK